MEAIRVCAPTPASEQASEQAWPPLCGTWPDDAYPQASANDEDEYVITVTVEGKGGAHEAHRRHAEAIRGQLLRTLLGIAEDLINQ